MPRSCRVPHDLDFRDQPYALRFFDRLLYALDQPLDVGRAAGAAGIDDEVGVLLRDARAAFGRLLQPAGLDQLRRGLALGGIAEHAARVRQLQRLRGAALGEQRLHDFARLLAVALGQLEVRRGEPFVAVAGDVGFQFEVPVAELELLLAAATQLAGAGYGG